MQAYLKPIKIDCCQRTTGTVRWPELLHAHCYGELPGPNWGGQFEHVDPIISQVMDKCLSPDMSTLESVEDYTQDVQAFGPLRPLYTQGTHADTIRRALHCLDKYVRTFLPLAQPAGVYPVISTFSAVLHAAAQLLLTAPCDTELLAARMHMRMYAALRMAGMAQTDHTRDAQQEYLAMCICRSAICELLQANFYIIRLLPAITPREFTQTYMYPLLAELIELGPHVPEHEMPEPGCGIPRFQELCGVHN